MDLKKILEDHRFWLENAGGKRANLYGANLSGADLYGANLSRADLSRANLYGANLSGADLSRADLSRANLSRANLYGADLSRADLSRANLYGANLSGANLSRANLSGADLSRADLSRANLSGAKGLYYAHIPEEGSFIGYKKVKGVVIKLQIPAKAKRTSSIVGRKCRAEYVKVLTPGINLLGNYDNKTRYESGKITRADSWNDDPRVECTHGIHFFITKKEAEEWDS